MLSETRLFCGTGSGGVEISNYFVIRGAGRTFGEALTFFFIVGRSEAEAETP